MAKYIPLSGELGAGKFAIVDDEDYDFLMRWKWSLGSGYACRTTTVKDVGYVGISMHNVVMPEMEGFEIDHINRNRLDNRKSNLRYCTRSQNCGNKSLKSTNTSGYKGVSRKQNRHCVSYYSCIAKDGHTYHLGCFDNPIDAAKAYDKKAVELFGEFAYLNFPEEP